MNKINIGFVRICKIYNKEAYLIIEQKRIKIKMIIIYYFIDVTYYAIPENNSEYKFLLIIGINNEE